MHPRQCTLHGQHAQSSKQQPHTAASVLTPARNTNPPPNQPQQRHALAVAPLHKCSAAKTRSLTVSRVPCSCAGCCMTKRHARTPLDATQGINIERPTTQTLHPHCNTAKLGLSGRKPCPTQLKSAQLNSTNPSTADLAGQHCAPSKPPGTTSSALCPRLPTPAGLPAAVAPPAAAAAGWPSPLLPWPSRLLPPTHGHAPSADPL
jgi:hypothetical protein